MIEYKYLTFDNAEKVENITKKLNELAEDGWELISHSHSHYGMSVFLEKFIERCEDYKKEIKIKKYER